MKKTRVFFMTLLVAITLFGFSGTSLAFELSDITAKPVQFFKYIVQKIGFGDDDEENAQKAESVETPSDKQSSADIPYYYINDTESVYLDLYPADLIIPLSSEWGTDKYEWLYYHEKISYNYENKEWYFRIGSRAGKSYHPFSYGLSESAMLHTNAEYFNDLLSGPVSGLRADIFLLSTFKRQPVFEPYTNHDCLNELYDPGSANIDYGFRINALIKNTKIGLYGWNVNHLNPLGQASLMEDQGAASDFLQGPVNSVFYQRSNNIAATVSSELPFMKVLHHGISPTVRFETAYRSHADGTENINLTGSYERWKIGIAYEGSNHIDWLNPYGINWGIGYNYTVYLDDPDNENNYRQGYTSYSGNISASTYWFNMKLNTMFMYLYDLQTRGSMTILNATYSPDWRWSYGIKANFYYGKKEGDNKDLNNSPELVTSFTATYRWD